MKIYFKPTNEQHSEVIQKILFQHGYTWEDGEVIHDFHMYLVLDVHENGKIFYCDDFKGIPKNYNFCSLDDFIANIDKVEELKFPHGTTVRINRFFKTVDILGGRGLSYEDIETLYDEIA